MTPARTGSQFLIALFALILVSPVAAQQAVEADVLLAGGTIYDGTGADGVVGDVAIRGWQDRGGRASSPAARSARRSIAKG